eukprot:TRINITY_DN10322_c0_g1_i2.p1 TRINITY_DN10322_c0_g1~~TRINITY_DN10322_c0_g1_i2.p1  ORF type:complete len:171 (+),score=17.59 TRINITY_DN10322_c0_g1_i2:99-611(+)
MDRPAKRSKLMERAEEHVSKGEYYDAVMLYKGQVARGSGEKVRDVCCDGVEKLSACGQHKLASELGVCGVEKLGLGVSQLLLTKMSDESQKVFLEDVLNWASTHASPSHDPKLLESLHRTLGVHLSRTQSTYPKAQHHLLQGGPSTAPAMLALTTAWSAQIGRASCRERV